jgi:hypothetical protein
LSNRSIAMLPRLVLVLAVTLLTAFQASAQDWNADSICPDNTPAIFHRCVMEITDPFEPLRTPDGRPDIGGNWVLPGGQTGGAYEDLEEHALEDDAVGGPTTVVDPSDGRLPMRAWVDAQVEENAQRYIHHNAACFLAGVPNTMYHGGPRQFIQTAEHLAVLSYNTHAFRIVLLDGRPHVGEKIRLWNGDSRGHWEKNTLVVETANQNARAWLDQRGRFFTEEAHVVERLTLIDANTIHYEATVDDPNIFTRPFTIAFPYRRIADERYEIPELACYENNEALLEIYRTVGFGIFPGITAEEAEEAAVEQ